MNELDRSCQTLQHGYECIMMDLETSDIECDPWSELYIPVISTTDFETMGISACTYWNRNGGQFGFPDFGVCAELACVVETQFVDQVRTILEKEQISADEATLARHDENFDTSLKCPIKKNSVSSKERKCCGSFPCEVAYFENAFLRRIVFEKSRE